DLLLTNELTSAAAGSHYYVDRPGVVTVSADGLATAIGEGTATVTIINGPTESVIPIHVEAPPPPGLPVPVGAEGGIVQASDGSIVAIPPGDLTEATTVSISP